MTALALADPGRLYVGGRFDGVARFGFDASSWKSEESVGGMDSFVERLDLY